MKKIFTLIATALVATSMSAQTIALDDNWVIYTTCDTVTFDEGEALPWTTASLANGFNSLGLYYEATAIDNDPGYAFAFRTDYRDPETGFSLPHGYYRLPMLDQGKMKFYGGEFVNPSTMETVNATLGISNLKKVILYCVGLPNYKSADGQFNNQDLFTGRIEAQYMSANGDTVSNLSYREVKANTAIVPELSDQTDWNYYIYTMKDHLNYDCLHDGVGNSYPQYVIYDRPFKLTINLDNQLTDKELKALESDFADREDLGCEFVNYQVDGMTEAEMSYYFATRETAIPYINNPDRELRYTSATGYNVYKQKWGDRVAWTEDTPIQIAIKNRILIAGIAFISDSDGNYLYGDASMMDEFNPNPNKAYGVNENMWDDFQMDVDDPWADRRPDSPTPPTPTGKKGDANGDGIVDVADITAIASYILGTTPEAWNADNADANSDSKIDVADITGTAGIILGN